MPLALILSSFVAASRIGGAAQQYVLAAHRIDPMLAPTVMFGRTPARGSKGEVTAPDVFRRMLDDVAADALFGEVDLVLTGHFSDPEQVDIAAEAIARVRNAPRAAGAAAPHILVDPVLGDAPKGLYIRYDVAEAVESRLVPLADVLTPNLWELGFLTDREVGTLSQAWSAARTLGPPVLVTSAPAGEGETGLLYVDRGEATLFAHAAQSSAPNGTGDLVAAAFGAGLVKGLAPLAAAEQAARAACDVVAEAARLGARELPIVALADRIVNPRADVRIERL